MSDSELNIRVFLVDDDKTLLKAITQAYQLDNFDVVAISDPLELLSQISRDFHGVVVTDVRMPQIEGIELFNKIKAIDHQIPVIFMTGHADVPMVLNALRDGIFDFFSKPIDSELLLASTRRAIETRRLVLENRELRELSEQAADNSSFIGETPVMRQLRDTIRQVAKADIDVFIEGETGTGKEVVANLLHQWSDRTPDRFVAVNCAALPDDIAEDELFGAKDSPNKLSWRENSGSIESSHTGTLFLDEVGNLPLAVQGQLLPVIENRQIKNTDNDKFKNLDLRIVASSKTDLSAAIEQNQFRADLFYRLNTVHLRLPALRNRKEDIPLLFSHFISESAKKFSKKIPKLNTGIRNKLNNYDWPGNVRELKNFADSLVLGIEIPDSKNLMRNTTLPECVALFESNMICSALMQSEGDVRSTLEILGIPRKTFYDKVSRHKIDIKKFRNHSSTDQK